jgi:hypothetical protein
MKARMLVAASAASFGIFAAGCANDGSGGLLTTQGIAPAKAETAAKVDPACASLASQIDTLRKDAAVESLEKASAGKSSNVSVKRASLAKQAELNKANADFQTKCGPVLPKPQSAQAPASAAVQPVASAAADKASLSAAKTVAKQ